MNLLDGRYELEGININLVLFFSPNIVSPLVESSKRFNQITFYAFVFTAEGLIENCPPLQFCPCLVAHKNQFSSHSKLCKQVT
jgi:hypothetical protein